MGEENNCKRYSEGKCTTGDVCVGKEREAYRMRCKHYSDVSGHCRKQ